MPAAQIFAGREKGMVVSMRKKRFEFEECVVYCGFDNLPEGLSQYFDLYEEKEQSYLIGKVFLQDIFDRYQIPQEKQSIMLSAIDEIEQDTVLFYFTKFLVWDMCSARNRCDIDNYTNMMPVCLKEYKEFYSLLLLFACVEPSMQLLMDRGVPLEYYQQIPYQPMEAQLKKWLDKDDISVSDFPWDMNFYTCAIFLMDRFFFIPYKFGDNLTMYRNHSTNKVIALRHADEEFRRDGQVNGINKVFDETGKFTSVWLEEADFITANPISPMGYVQKEPITIHKEDWDTALEPGDTLLALHVPSGPGYTPERLRTSMMLALEFYKKYFPELPIKGFWSESWLYDSRLSLILDNEKSNIIKVQKQFYLYPINEGDDMLRYEAFGDWKADPKDVELTTTLQKAAAAYMQTGARFNSLSMVVLKEEADKMGSTPYTTSEDIERFKRIVDSHLKKNS